MSLPATKHDWCLVAAGAISLREEVKYKFMTDFLPKDYELPESERRYAEFEEGANTFRILTPAIVGYE